MPTASGRASSKSRSEITNKSTERLGAAVGLSAPAFNARVEAGNDWQEQEKRVFRHRAQEAVNALQIRDLKETISWICGLHGQK